MVLERNMQLHPRFFGRSLRENLVSKLMKDVEGTIRFPSIFFCFLETLASLLFNSNKDRSSSSEWSLVYFLFVKVCSLWIFKICIFIQLQCPPLIDDSGRHGFVLAVTGIESIGKGLIRDGTPFVTFPVKYRCVVFRPFEGEVLEAVVTTVMQVIYSSL